MKTINKMQILRGTRLIHDPYSSPHRALHSIAHCLRDGEAQFMNKETAPGAMARNALPTIRHRLREKDD